MSTRDFRKSVSDGSYASMVNDAPEVSEPAGFAEDEGLATPDFEAEESASEEVTEPEAEDYSWAEPLKPYQELHGLKLQELIASLAEGKIPEALWDKLRIPLKDGENEWEDTIASARNGAMMRHNYTKKLQQFAAERDAFNQQRESLTNYLGGWKNDASGKQLLAGLRRMGMPVEAAAKALAEEFWQAEELAKAEAEGKIPAGTAEGFKRQKAMEQELEELRQQRQAFDKKTQEEQSQSQAQATGIKTRDLAVKTFEQVGLKLTEGSWNIFREHLAAIWTAKGTQDVSPEEVRFAVEATKDTIAERVAQHQAAVSATTPVTHKPGIKPMDAAAGNKPTPVARPKAMTTREARKFYGLK